MFECEIEGFVSGQKFRKVYEKKCESLMVKYDLRKIELDVLFFLDRYENYDTARDIVNRNCLSKAHVSKAIENLTHREYLITTTNRGDRRCLHLSVTEHAKPIIKELNLVWRHMVELIYADLTEEEIKVLRNAFTKISANIEFQL